MAIFGQNQHLGGKVFTPGVMAVLALLFVGFLLNILMHDFIVNVIALNPQAVIKGMIWQLVTYPFAITSPVNLIFSGLIVFLLGSLVEREWGSKSFITLWLVLSIGCGILWVLINLIFGKNFIGAGTSPCDYGFIAIIGLLYRGRKFYLFFTSVDAKIMTIIFLAIGILSNIMNPINLIWTAGAPIAYLFTKLMWKMSSNEQVIIDSLDSTRKHGFVDID